MRGVLFFSSEAGSGHRPGLVSVSDLTRSVVRRVALLRDATRRRSGLCNAHLVQQLLAAGALLTLGLSLSGSTWQK